VPSLYESLAHNMNPRSTAYWYCLMVLLSFTTCAQPNLVGTWDSRYLKVTVNTVQGTDSTGSVNVNPLNYEQIVGLKTARAYFKEDGTYVEHYLKPDGTIAYAQQGYWSIHEDTVVTSVYKPLKSQSVYRYHMKIHGDSAVFTSLMDYDGDGQEDDEFWGVSIRVDKGSIGKF